MSERSFLRRLLDPGLPPGARRRDRGRTSDRDGADGVVPRWVDHYPRTLLAYWRSGEDGLAEIEDELRTEAARQPEGKFSKTDAAYTPFVPLPPLAWRHKCGHCRFWVDSAPGHPGECMIVGRDDDPWGGTAIHEKAGCGLFVPPAGEPAFAWIGEQRDPTGADLVRGEYHAHTRGDGVDIPVDGETRSTRQRRRPRARRHETRRQIGDSQTPAGPTVDVELVADGLAAPVEMVVDPGADDRRFVADQSGVVHVLDADGLGAVLLDLRDRIVDLEAQYDERGLLGLALHPEFADDGRFYVRYSAPNRPGTPEEYDHTEVLSEFTAADDRTRVERGSERTLLEIPSPQFNHNAGAIQFGPDDGYLYVAVGDGGHECDLGLGHVEGGNGQDVTENLLGGVLRIDVDAQGDETAYGIPDDNPLVGETGRDEYYAWGLRNPWRMTFDSQGRLFVGDVGQSLFEEIDIVEKGGNYGWNVKEATHCFDPENPWEPPADCPDENRRGEPLLDPIVEYPHVTEDEVVGSAVVGGYYYESSQVSALQDRYVFGDWTTTQDKPSGRLFAAEPPTDDSASSDELWSLEEVEIAGSENGRLNRLILGFARDAEGELYVLSNETHVPKGETGTVHRIVAD